MRCQPVFKARIRRPGSRGGQYYITPKGEVRYGKRPAAHKPVLHSEATTTGVPTEQLERILASVKSIPSPMELESGQDTPEVIASYAAAHATALDLLVTTSEMVPEGDKSRRALIDAAYAVMVPRHHEWDMYLGGLKSSELRKLAQLATVPGWQWGNKELFMKVLFANPSFPEEYGEAMGELAQRKAAHQEKHGGAPREKKEPEKPVSPPKAAGPTDYALSKAWADHYINISKSMILRNILLESYGDPSLRDGPTRSDIDVLLDKIRSLGKRGKLEVTEWQEAVMGLRRHRLLPQEAQEVKRELIDAAEQNGRLRLDNKSIPKRHHKEAMESIRRRLEMHNTADLLMVLHGPKSKGLLVKFDRFYSEGFGKSASTVAHASLNHRTRRHEITYCNQYAAVGNIDTQTFNHEFAHVTDHAFAEFYNGGASSWVWRTRQNFVPGTKGQKEMPTGKRDRAKWMDRWFSSDERHPALAHLRDDPVMMRLAKKYGDGSKYPRVVDADTRVLRDGYALRSYDGGDNVGTEMSSCCAESMVGRLHDNQSTGRSFRNLLHSLTHLDGDQGRFIRRMALVGAGYTNEAFYAENPKVRKKIKQRQAREERYRKEAEAYQKKYGKPMGG